MRLVSKGVFILICTLILYINLKLLYTPSFSEGKALYNRDVYLQLRHLKKQIHQGAAKDMQQLYPEGFIFLNVLYGLTWCALANELPAESDRRKEALAEISFACSEVHSPYGRAIFDEDLPLKYGAFYRGWSNYLLGTKLSVQLPAARDSSEIRLFQTNCAEIGDYMMNGFNPYAESYKGLSWPADMVVAVASLSLYRNIEPVDRYKNVISNWVRRVKLLTDPNTGLVPHQVHPRTGLTAEGARGSSQSLMLNFLPEIDPNFGKAQFDIYSKLFLTSRLGLPAVREYPKGLKGSGDIDSGPVIWGIGGAASIVGQRTFFKHGDQTTYTGLRNSIEAFGLPLTCWGEKKYLLGALPIADAFIAWSNAAETGSQKIKTTGYWPWKFQLLSFGILVLLFWLMSFSLNGAVPRTRYLNNP